MRRLKSSNDRAPAFPLNLWLWLVLLGPALLLHGCLLTGGGGSSRRSAEILRSPDGPAMAMAAGLYQRGESLRTLAVRGGVSYSVGSRRHYFKFEAAAMKPGRILFTAFDPAGRPAFRLASDGELITGIIYGERQFAIGPATAENFEKILPLSIAPDQLIALMSGSQVRPAAAGARQSGSSTELVIQPAGGPADDDRLWRVRLDGGLDQNPATAVVQSADFGPARRPEVSIRYLSVKDVPREDLGGRPEPFPHSVEVDWTDPKRQSLRITYDEVRLGLDLPDAVFTLQRPDGFQLIQLP